MGRGRARISPRQEELLERLKVAKAERDDAQADYREAMLAAYHEAIPVAAIARTVGLSHPATLGFISRQLKSVEERR